MQSQLVLLLHSLYRADPGDHRGRLAIAPTRLRLAAGWCLWHVGSARQPAPLLPIVCNLFDDSRQCIGILNWQRHAWCRIMWRAYMPVPSRRARTGRARLRECVYLPAQFQERLSRGRIMWRAHMCPCKCRAGVHGPCGHECVRGSVSLPAPFYRYVGRFVRTHRFHASADDFRGSLLPPDV